MVAIDPRTFSTASVALAYVEDMYLNATNFFSSMADDLNSEASQFQGQAGEAFYQIIQNLYTAASKISSEMGKPNTPNSYSGMFSEAASMADGFLWDICTAVGYWEEVLAHTPMGAIYAAIINSNMGSIQDGNYFIPNAMNVAKYGNLLTDAAWMAIEQDAKVLWTQAVETQLDSQAKAADQPSQPVVPEHGGLYPAAEPAIVEPDRGQRCPQSQQ